MLTFIFLATIFSFAIFDDFKITIQFDTSTCPETKDSGCGKSSIIKPFKAIKNIIMDRDCIDYLD